jgi:hypothetical protein
VRPGEWVEAGDPLGISGNSGCSTGPHLHFGVEREWKATDPYGWRPTDRPDPLIAYAGAPATWLWLADDPSADGATTSEPPPALTGTLIEPLPEAQTNGELPLRFVPDEGVPPLLRIEFFAYYADAGSAEPSWHSIGVDEDGSDGWAYTWDTRNVPEGEVWLHAWVTGKDGRVGKGSPIRTGITVDRHPPLGYMVGLEPGSTAGARLWLYAASYDPASSTRQVTFLIRPQVEEDAPAAEWREIGDARWLHTSNWLLEWEPVGVPDGAPIDVIARLTDGAGNAAWTLPVEGVTIERTMPGGQLVYPASGVPLTTTVDLRFLPLVTDGSADERAPIDRVAFYVWHDGDWHLAGVDRYGDDGWSVAWDPAPVADQPRMRVQARVYDDRGRINTALPQVTDLTLDRTPPSAGYSRPRSGGVARPDVAQRVWAWDGGSGVARVEFYVNDGLGWLKIGEDAEGQDGWALSAPWLPQGIADGLVSFSARVYDRAGNARWTEDQREVALDRTPPEGRMSWPLQGAQISGTITLTLEVSDTLSGLDRAIFYAQRGERWHHLGVDATHEDGLTLAWDTAPLVGWEDVALTAWVYDRAGNLLELPHVGRLAIGSASTAAVSLVAVPQPTLPPPTLPAPTLLSPTLPAPTLSSPTEASATHSPSPTWTPPSFATPSPSAPLSKSSPLPALSATPTMVLTRVPATKTSPLLPTATPLPTATVPMVPSPLRSPVHPAFWPLVGGGVLVAIVLMVLAFRTLK